MLVIEMDSITSIAKNTIVLLISRIILIMLGFFYTLYTARYLGTEGYGVLSFALALGGIFNVVSDLGLSTMATREISRDRQLANKYFMNASILKAVLIILASAAIVIFVNAARYPEKTIVVVYLITIYYILFSFVTLFYSIFQSYERMEYMSLGAIINSIMMLAGAFAAIYFKLDIVSFSSIYCISIALVLIYCLVICFKKFFIFRPDFSLDFCKKALAEAWPVGVVAICSIVSFRIGTVILSIVKGDSAVGIYGAAYTLSDTTTIVPTILAAAIFPTISKYHTTSRELFNTVAEKSVKYVFYLALPMAMVITIWAGPIIQAIYGDNFSGSIDVLRIIIWSAAVAYASMMLGTIMITANLQMISMKINIGTMILNIALNLLLIPIYGVLGTSLVSFMTVTFTVMVSVYILEKLDYNVNILKLYILPIGGVIIAGSLCFIMIQMQINLVLITLTGIALYSGIVLVKGIEKEELQLFTRVFGSYGRIKSLTRKH
jgi:O-antigen/teichoic acid export membrane protein